LRVCSTVIEVKLKLVRRQGTQLKHLKHGSLQEKKAVGDHWILLDSQGNPLTDEVGEHPFSEKTDYFFRLHPENSEILHRTNAKVELLLVSYWPHIRDSEQLNKWFSDMASALVIIRNEDGTAWRLASLVMRFEDWMAQNPQPVIVDLV
jgi:hypothetical protein